jgi:hypothetical protein
MKRVLLLLLLVAGCRTFEVNAFGVPLRGEPRYLSASTDDEGLSTEEKLGVILLVGIAIGGAIALGAAASH